jgi:hypothetical protein
MEMVRALLDEVPAERMVDWVASVCSSDRYQASDGLADAAALVAGLATESGLGDVSVQWFPADGRAQWWTFEAPRSWTPSVAAMSVTHAGVPIVRLDHARDPFAVATYSAATPAGGVSAPVVPFAGAPVPAGALAVVRQADLRSAAVVPQLAAGGAIGYLTDAFAKGDSGEYRGRVELPLHSNLLAFSLTAVEMELVVQAMRDPAGPVRADVTVHSHGGAGMPVVTGVLPGEALDEEEVWLTAHLCHPRPSANDNASGVAALLGVASALGVLRRRDDRWRSRRSIRFLWGPEFVGTAAALYGRAGRPGAQGPPHVLINLDMVGEDQRRCRSPFVLEKPPDYLRSFLGPVAEYVVDRVFAATAGHPGHWTTAPFLGFSDHALVADPSFARAGVQLCHPADRFNHSAGDTVDNVSAVEMTRSAVIAATLAMLTAGAGDADLDRTTILTGWATRERAAARAAAAEVGGAWGSGLVGYVDRRIAEVARAPTYRPEFVPRHPPVGGLPRRNWDGPLNLRAMIGALGPDDRSRVDAMVAGDKTVLSLLFHCAIRADGRRTAEQIIAETSFELRRPIPGRLGAILLDILQSSGWMVTH